jgi:hypothetical protein
MKTTVSRVLNLIFYLCFCGAIGTGLTLAFRLPPGSRGGGGLTILGLDRHEWGEAHLWLALTSIGLTLIHLAMHWKWLIKTASSGRMSHLALGLGLGLAIVAFCLLLPVTKGKHVGPGHSQKEERGRRRG